MPILTKRAVSAAAVLAGCLFLSTPVAQAGEDIWPTLRQQTFGDRAIQAEDGIVVLEIPGTADDASLVPLTVRVPPQVTQNLKSLTLFIDKNPDPEWRRSASGPRRVQAASAASPPGCASTISLMCAPCSRPEDGSCIWRANSWRRPAVAGRCRPRIPTPRPSISARRS